MAHDEIRHCGWDDSCAKRELTCGQILADNVRKCTEIIQKAEPGKPIVTWNDMFDPFHNAHKEGWMYLAKGDGPWYGSWEGLPPQRHRRQLAQQQRRQPEVLRRAGQPQILAGYYDADPAADRGVARSMAAKVKGVCGVMYTTWVDDYSKLEVFMKNVKEFEGG